MRMCVSFGCALVLMAGGASFALADEAEPLAVGGKVPPVKLKDQDGAEQSLDALLKRGKVALVFYRSADW